MTAPAPALARTPAPTRARDPFFDAVRALAIVRVVAWHALQWPVLSYIAAMPVMFFVGGTLAGPSFAGRPTMQVLRRRLKRLLPPLWVYGVVAWVVFAVGGATIGLRSTLAWIVPLWDPTGPDHAVAWWAPLWYLRAYLWLLLLTPVMLAALRRAGAVVALGASVATAVAVALAADGGLQLPSQVEDLAIYGVFWMFGLAGPQLRSLASRITPRGRAAIAATFALAAAAWLVVRPAPLGIVNASPMAETLLGGAWIVGLTAVARHVTAFAALELPRRVIGVLNRRAMTTYLWHCGAIALAHGALDALHVGGGARTVALTVLVTVLTVALVSAAGPVEDLTAPRRGITAGAVRALVGIGVVPCLLVAVIVLPVGDVDNAEGAYVPASGRGLDRLIANDAGAARSIDEAWTQPDGPVDGAELATLVDEWRARWDISGVIVGVGRSDGVVWTGASGVDAVTGQEMSGGQAIPAHSITKSFTGALVTQLHVERRLDLDESLAAWVPEFPHAAAMTLRQLAQHSSGLVDTGKPLEEALAIAGGEPLQFTPGEGTNYSDSAYYLLAVAAERATGERYEELVAERFLAPLGLDATALATDRWAAGGITSTARDLVRWAPQFWGGALGTETAAEATALDPSSNFGIGTFGYCPCRGLGALYRAELYGHLSAQGRLAWDPRDDLAVMVHTNEENDGGRTIDAWTELDWLLRRQVRGRPIASAS